jgi:sulfatase maturation enzyme AslB (radical SAM superfamily)
MSAPATVQVRLRPSPFLHVEAERVYNPLTDIALSPGDAGYESLRRLLAGVDAGEVGGPEVEDLRRAGWLVVEGQDVSASFRLKYVSLEAHTVCNQSCYFCPVSVAPRQDHFMPMELYRRIVEQLAAHRATIEAVFMINYNEPTADPRFVEQVGLLGQAKLPAAVLTNATGLTPDRADAIVELGGLRYLSVNLSTLDRAKYQHDRGGDHLALVLRNLDYLKELPVAEQMEIVVLGTADEVHERDFAEIRERFAGSRFTVKSYEVMDRAGYMQIGRRPASPNGHLCGCDNLGSRPLQHLHITPHGKCVLCCEDYDEKYVVGDLNLESVDEVLSGPRLGLLRRWIYGLEEAPRDFLCRGCTFALTAPQS